MKIFVLYDEEGKIRGTMATTLEDIGVKPSSGMHVHMFERDTLNAGEQRRYLGELHNNFRVANTPSGESTLVQKSATPRGRQTHVE